ncbi:unnamed protein product, partial [Rotaria sordida]
SIITFDNNNGRWIHEAIDKQGKKVHIERYVDDKDQQQVELSCENQNIENDSSDTNTSSQQIPTPELKLSTSQDVASSTIPKKSSSSIEKEVKAVTCNGNPCSNCGKCREWYYDGNIDRDNERFERGESYDIVDRNRWHRRPNGTCRYFYFHHVGILGKHHGLDICRCP